MSAYAKNYGYFFNSNSGDRTYNAESFEEWLKPFFLSGVFQGELQVKAQTTPDMTVKVTAGHANLDGKAATWDSENTMQLSVASGVYDRIDTIVLRRDNVNRTISIEVVTGTASADPQPTAPTRTANTFELVLAKILVGTGVTAITQANITDTRMDSDVCGYVAATVDQIDFDQIYAQYEAWQADTQEYFNDWFEAIRGQLDDDAAGHLQNEVDDLRNAIAFMQNGTTATRNYDKDDYLYITNHPQITDGLYVTDSGIISGAVIESRFVIPVYTGGFNWLNVKMNHDISAIQEGIALIWDGDYAPKAISAGTYVYVINSTYASDGLYITTTTVSEHASIWSANLSPCSDNDGAFNELNSNIATKTTAITSIASQSNYTLTSGGVTNLIARCGNVVTIQMCVTCSTPYTNSPGVEVLSNVPIPASGEYLFSSFPVSSIDSAASRSLRVVVRNNGKLYFRHGEASKNYDIVLTYITA